MNKSVDRTIQGTTQAPAAAERSSAIPGRGTGTTDRGAATRQRIIEAAIAIIAERGWAAVTTREVARRAGVQQAQIGYHFGSKDMLLRSAIVTAFDQVADGVAQLLVAQAGEPLDVRPLIGTLDAADADHHLTLVGTEALSLALRDAELGDWMRGQFRQLRGQLAERLAAAHADGTMPGGADPQGVALIISALMDGLLFVRALDPTLDLTAAADALDALLMPRTPATRRSDP